MCFCIWKYLNKYFELEPYLVLACMASITPVNAVLFLSNIFKFNQLYIIYPLKKS